MEAEDRSPAAEVARGSSAGPAPPDEAARLEPTDRGLHERCAHHGTRPAVARCDACGEPLCLGCAIPVRGRVLGPGCVAEELGDPALVAPAEPDRDRSWVTVAGALAAALGTVAPWTRTGAGDRLLGAWVLTARWSLVAALASVVLVGVAWRRAGRSGRAATLTLAGVVVVASALAIVFPPTFQAASWGPWVTACGGAVAGGSIWRWSGRTAGPIGGV